jgi:hypothetical protein
MPPFFKLKRKTMSNFNNHSNLTQTLNAIMLQHFKDINKSSDDTSPSMPPLVLEALHQISFNLAALMNYSYLDVGVWNNIASYADVVSKLITAETEAQKEKQNQAEEKEEEQEIITNYEGE